MSRKAKIIFTITGIIILAILIKSFGINTLIRHLKEIGWKFIFIVLIHIFANLCFTFAWRLVIEMPMTRKQFGKMMLARLAGDSTSSINAIGAVAGEPLKAVYIKDFVPFKMGLASVILDRTIHNFANVLILLTGICLSLFMLDLPGYVILISFLIVIVLLVVSFFIFKTQRSGFIEYFLNILPKKITARFMTENKLEKIREIDKHISAVMKSGNRKKVYISLIIHYMTTLLIASLELYLIAIFIGINNDFNFSHAVFVYIFGFFFSTAAFFMPANIGVSEGSYALALKLLGFDAGIGVSMGFVRRLRAFTLAGIGVLLLMHAGILKKEKKTVHSVR